MGPKISSYLWKRKKTCSFPIKWDMRMSNEKGHCRNTLTFQDWPGTLVRSPLSLLHKCKPKSGMPWPLCFHGEGGLWHLSHMHTAPPSWLVPGAPSVVIYMARAAEWNPVLRGRDHEHSLSLVTSGVTGRLNSTGGHCACWPLECLYQMLPRDGVAISESV